MEGDSRTDRDAVCDGVSVVRSTQTVLCDQALDADPPEWVHLLPLGMIEGRDGRSFVNDDPTAILSAFQQGKIDLPIDYEHQNDKGNATGPIPAAGWITQLRSDPKGLWGKVSWTATAKRMIAAREYRFLSPVIVYRPGSKSVIKLKGASLVHNPNLQLTALASEEDQMDKDKPPFMQRLAEMLGLDTSATEDDVLAAITDMMKKVEEPDPSKFVPMDAMQAAMRDRGNATTMMAQERTQSKVNDALRRGYISPGMKEWATALCNQSEAQFDEFIATSVPQFAHLHQASHLDRLPPSRGGSASEDRDDSEMAAQVCRQLGLKPGTLNS